jgi:hypothetical protein
MASRTASWWKQFLPAIDVEQAHGQLFEWLDIRDALNGCADRGVGWTELCFTLQQNHASRAFDPSTPDNRAIG